MVNSDHCTQARAGSLDAAKAETVVGEIGALGGDAISVPGDVGAEDFPEKILKATVEWVFTITPALIVFTLIILASMEGSTTS